MCLHGSELINPILPLIPLLLNILGVYPALPLHFSNVCGNTVGMQVAQRISRHQ